MSTDFTRRQKQIPIKASKKNTIIAKVNGGGIALALCSAISKQTFNQIYNYVMVIEDETERMEANGYSESREE